MTHFPIVIQPWLVHQYKYVQGGKKQFWKISRSEMLNGKTCCDRL